MAKKLEELTDGVIETEFLIIGGGIVGSIAALRAKKNNKDMDITIIDKARMEYSGDGVGLDNFNQVPLHKEDINRDVTQDDVNKAVFGAERLKGLKDFKLDAIQMKNAYISQPLLEEIGVRIREDDGSLKVVQGYRKGTVWGRVEYDENGKPTEPLFGTFSRASDLKMKLGTAVRKTGTRVLDRTMLTSIITRDGVAIGATALNTRTGKFLVLKAKAILLATGAASRLYPYQWSQYPNHLFYTLTSPVNDGGGHVSAFNAGVKLYSMEFSNVYNVSKGINHSSGGGACNWYFKMYNSKGEFLEDKYPDRVVTKAGGKIPGINFLFAPDMQNAEVEKDVILSAKHNATDDEIAAVYFTAVTEPPKALKFHKLAGGLTNERPVECIAVLTGIGQAGGGILRENEYSETCVKNLFAAGNVTGNGGSHGFTWGCLIADHVTQLVKDQKQLAIDSEQLKQIEETRNRVFSPLNRNTEYKVNPLELEDYIRQVNYNFIGIHKVKSKIERAIELIRFAREGAVPLLVASNPHELMRAIEVQNIIEISELHAQSSLLRTESRLVPVHYREDYPELDPKWDNKIVTVKKIDNEIKYDIEDLN
ncbi:MAG TPA: FAD-binding protein [Firmicutes bacterium]|nr:FAD-binding protein [Bacillota bacterium]